MIFFIKNKNSEGLKLFTKMSYTDAALRGCGVFDTLMELGKIGWNIAKNPDVQSGAQAFLSGFKGGREFPATEAERQQIIDDLKKKYAKTLRKYAKFRAEYPYTVEKAAEILKNREDRRRERAARRRAPPAPSRRRYSDDSDIIYPEGFEPVQPRRRPRRRSIDLGDVLAPPPRARQPPIRYR